MYLRCPSSDNLSAILGIVKGIMDVCASIDVRAVMVAPYFTKTAILPADFVSPDPRKGLCRMEDVVGAFVASITDDKYNFGCWLIPDDKGVVRMDVTGSL